MAVVLGTTVIDGCGFRYNCNRYDEDEAKKARDSQEVRVVCDLCYFICWYVFVY